VRTKNVVLLLAMGLGAFLLRLAGVRWGIPGGTHFFSFHPDEFSTAGTAVGMLAARDLNPHFFHYGSLTIYLTLLIASAGESMGLVSTVVETHVIARVITALFGAATVPLVFLLARKCALADPAGEAGPRARFADRMALTSAVFLALLPGHVLHSQFATVDVPATFFVTAALLASIACLADPRPRAFLAAGALAGLAASTKYNTGIVLLSAWTAALLARRSAAVHIAISAAAALVAFLATTPYALLDFQTFRDDLSYELFEHPREGHLNIFENTGNGWWHHLSANLPYVTGAPFLVLTLAGLVRQCSRRARADLVLFAFAAPYFLALGFSEVRFLRYLLPLAGVLAIGASFGLNWIAERFPPGMRQRAELSIAGLVLASLAFLVLRQTAALAHPDSRLAAADWMIRNAPPRSTVGLVHVPWFYTPPLVPWNGGPESRHEFEKLLRGEEPYRFSIYEDWDLARLSRIAPEYFVISEFEWREERRLRDAKALAFLDALEAGYREAAVFRTFPKEERWVFGGFAPHDWLYPFADVKILQKR
jgi:hypothetical protein